MCRCLRNNENCCNHFIIRKRCVCWYEAVLVRPPRRRRCQCQIVGMSLQLINGDENLPTDYPIVFDEVLTKNSDIMCCRECEGVIEIHECGTYLVDWNVTVESSETASVSFSLEVNGKIETTSTLSVPTGQLSGQALIPIKHAPATIRLVNTTGSDVQLSTHSPVANLRIVTLGE